MMGQICNQCGFENPLEMRFCGNCGTRLDSETVPEHQIDIEEQRPLQERLGILMGNDLIKRFKLAGIEARGQRRNVTVLFVDLTGYTQLSETLGDEDLYELIQKFISSLIEDVYRYEGMVDKLTGDGLMALFGAPLAHENNAERALRAAIDMQTGIHRLSQSITSLHGIHLSLHIGLNSGTLIVGGVGSNTLMNYTAVGDSVNLARRLEEIANPDEILVSDSVYGQTSHLFDYEIIPITHLKGISRQVKAFRFLGVKAEPGYTRGIDGLYAPMVGRETEMAQLTKTTNRLIQHGQGSMILLLGEGGIGKSRLTAELKNQLDPAQILVLEGRSLTYRKTLSYWIFQDVIRSLIGATSKSSKDEIRSYLHKHINELQVDNRDDILPYLEILFSFEPDNKLTEKIRFLEAGQLRQQIFLSVRNLLVAEARRKPLLLILEDLHWADDASLDLLLFLSDTIRREPIVIFAISRPYEEEIVNKISERGHQRLGTRFIQIHLQALQPDQSEQLLNSLLTVPHLPEYLEQQIIKRASGSPFYLEEILRMLIENKSIYRSGNHWMLSPGLDAPHIGVPDNLQGLILARFDRLDAPQRRLLQTATVIGEHFNLSVLSTVLNDISPGTIEDMIHKLVEREFILPETASLEHDFTFRHTLVSDAIYSTLLQRDRREIHYHVGLAIEKIFSNHIGAQVEILAGHFIRSTALERALHYLILAAQKMANAYANDQARQFFIDAMELLPQVEHTRKQELEVQNGLGNALLISGDYPAAREQFEKCLRLIEDYPKSDPTQTYILCASLERKIATTFERQGSYAEALDRLSIAKIILEDHSGDAPVELAQILNETGWIAFRRGDLDEAEDLLHKALALAEPVKQYDVIASVYNRLGGICFQRDQLDRAKNYVETSLTIREQIGDIVAVARTHNNLGLLGWNQGEWDSALKHFTQSYQLHANLGDVEGMIELNNNLGLLQIDRGNFLEAQKHLEEALVTAQQIGHTYHIGLAYLHLLLLHITTEEWNSALNCGNLSLELFTSIGVQEFLPELYSSMGMAWLGLNHLENAQDCAKQARELFEQLGGSSSGRIDNQARILRLLGGIARAKQISDEAADFYLESADLFGEAGNQLERGRSLVYLCEVLVDSKEDSLAEKYMHEASKIFNQLGANQDLDKLAHIIEHHPE